MILSFYFSAGLYGHSAVYNEASKTIYVYGGHVYRQERLFVSDSLFTFDIITKSWNILQPEKNSVVSTQIFKEKKSDIFKFVYLRNFQIIIEPLHEKTNKMLRRKQRRRSAVQ